MENKHTSRRDFIAKAGKAGLALGLASTIIPSFANTLDDEDAFKQQPLPYGYADLEAAIDAQTMEIHYTKHAAGYTKNLNDAYVKELKRSNLTLEQILGNVSKYSAKVRNNAGGHYNHEFFWQCMTSTPRNAPMGKLFGALTKEFGSIENFKTKFNEEAKARFGSGFTWLILTPEKKLKIFSTPNQDNPLMDIAEIKGKPLLALDVWEHAYYLRYQNKRAEYVENFWKVVNWSFVQSQFDRG